MYTITTIQDSFLSLIGFRQNQDPTGHSLTNLTTSDSGLYYQDAHPLITIQNLESIAENFNDYTYTAYSGATVYSLGNIVSSGGVNYIYINSTSASGNAVTDSDYWDNLFTWWLKNKIKGSISKLIGTWFNQKYMSKSAKNLLADTRLFYHDGFGNETGSASSNFKAFEVFPKKGKGLKYKIRSVYLQCPSSETVTLELRKVGNTSAIQSQSVASGSWVDLTSFEFDGDGTYQIGYSDSVVYTNGVKDYSEYVAGITVYPKSSKYFRAKAFESTDLTDPNKTDYTTSDNYGLNLEIEVSCDYTDFIVDQRLRFKDALYYQVACDLLKELIYNPHANETRNQKNIKDPQIMLHDLGMDTQGGVRGVKKQFDDALNSIKFDETAISADCLMCRKRGVIYGSV